MIDAPSSNEAEVTLLGTGGGYGESIVIHLGNGKWAVVDSCINPKTKESLPKELLSKKGVDLGVDVELIICSHWHDDHVRGISELLAECRSAKFCMADTTDTDKFLLLLGLDDEKAKSEPISASFTELKKCIGILESRDQPVTLVVQDRLIYRYAGVGLEVKVHTLSPSDLVIEEFRTELSTLISDFGSTERKIVRRTPNEQCVVLFIKINGHGILLGADMEVSADERRGWKCIVNNCQCIDVKSTVYKVPHHGSENGYEQSVWEKLLDEKLIATLTPWNKGRGLPNKPMLERLFEATENLYITSSLSLTRSPKKRSREINKAITQLNSTVVEQKYSFGAVQSRLDYSQSASNWETKLFQSAVRVDSKLLSSLS